MKNKGWFKKGRIPYNKDMKRGSVSPDTEFKEGEHSPNFQGYGIPHVHKRKNRKSEVYVTVPEKIKAKSRGREYKSRKRVSYARYLWIKHFGSVPDGMIVYNTVQEGPIEFKNLKLLTRSELLRANREKYK